MITYSWTFPVFDVAPSEDGLTDVVKTIHWRYDAVDGQYRAGAYGSVTLAPPDPNAFVPYDQITSEWAISCVSSQVNVPELDVNLAMQIADEKNPPVVPMPPPF